MRSALVVIVALAACRDSGPSQQVIVNTLAGDRVEPNVTVIAHSPGGDVVDITTADPTGRAQIGVNADSLVSVVFPGEISNVTPMISVITTQPPLDGSELTFHGPPNRKTPPLIVGVLQLDGPNLNAADYFNVTLGCVTVVVDRLPATIDVSSCNLGSDQNLDILVRGYHDTGTPPAPHLDGYGAGRAEMTDGVATFRVSQWRTTGTTVAVTQTGVQAALTWTMRVDGLDFLSEPMSATPYAFMGLMVDTTLVDALVPAAHGARITTRTFTATPATIALADSDFLPALEPVPTSTVEPATIKWAATASEADALHAHAAWSISVSVSGVVPPGPRVVLWDAILPPDATSVTLPTLDGDLHDALAPTSIEPTDIVLRAVDSSALDGFAAVVAAGIRAEETKQVGPIVDQPTDGQVRVAQSNGTQ